MSNGDAIEEPSIQDELEDLSETKDWAEGAVLWSTDWTAETIIAQLNRGNIDLQPAFQRRSAWTLTKKSLFIESLILGLPIPQIILAEDKNSRGKYIVIDGKQRLLALKSFAAKEGDEFERLRLAGLIVKSNLNRVTYNDLESSPKFSNELAAFQNASIRTIVIRNWKHETYLYTAFLRINMGSVPLSPQELRQALHPGRFSAFIDSESANSYELQMALNLSMPDFRMRDAELLLRYLSYRRFSRLYRGNLKEFLDNVTAILNERFDVEHEGLQGDVEQMNEAYACARQIFGENDYLRKWNGVCFERAKNRAVIDIMLYYFSFQEIRNASILCASEVKFSFIRLCENKTFLASIERTTKSLDANRTRFGMWAETLADITGLTVVAPDFGE